MKFAVVHYRRCQVLCRSLETGAASFIRLSASFYKRECGCPTNSPPMPLYDSIREHSVKPRCLCCSSTLLPVDGEMRLGNDFRQEASLYKAHLCRQDSTDTRIEYVSTGTLFGCNRLVTPGRSETDLYKRTTAGEYVRVRGSCMYSRWGFWIEEWGSRGI